MNMLPVKIFCFKYEDSKYNGNNIGLKAVFGRVILGLDFKRTIKVYRFDALDPKKLGLTKPE